MRVSSFVRFFVESCLSKIIVMMSWWKSGVSLYCFKRTLCILLKYVSKILFNVELAIGVKGAGPIGGLSDPLFASESASSFPVTSDSTMCWCSVESNCICSAQCIHG